ncbi:MAG: FapA family protein, partial [Deltaproteobacteria bacterium]
MTARAKRVGGHIPTREEVDAECARLGVVFGLDEPAIERLCAGKAPASVELTLAAGVPPHDAQQARIEYRFVLPTENHAYTEAHDDEPVDYREGLLIENVSAGDVLATKVPGTPGQPGRTVTGQVVPQAVPKDLTLAVGSNVKLSPDGLSAIAMSGGRPALEGGRVSVITVLEVKTVNYATGNIHFDGPVFVRGDVDAGFAVCATGDIEVSGIVEGGTLISGGNVVVRAGVRNHGRIHAAGRVAVNFVDSDSEIQAIGDVIVQASATQARIEAGGSLTIARTATGDIEVSGIVEGGTLISGGNVVVRAGVRNHGRI